MYAKLHRDASYEMHISNDGPEVISSYASRKSRSKITVWMPWPLNCDLGGVAKWPNHFHLHIMLHMYRSTGNASSVHVWLAGYPDILLLLWNAKSQIRSLVCTLHNSNIAITSLLCTLRNSKCAIQITHFALVWKQSLKSIGICHINWRKKKILPIHTGRFSVVVVIWQFI